MLENTDTGAVIKTGADALCGDGLLIRLPEKRSSAVYLYKKLS